jgi:hypothetical protein
MKARMSSRHLPVCVLLAIAATSACGKDDPSEADTEGTGTSTTTGSTTGNDAGATTRTTDSAEGSTGERHFGCCEAHRDPGCEEPAVQQCVCEIDAVCCTFEWDANCASVAQTMCSATCMAVGDTGGGTTGASDTAGTTGSASTSDGGDTTTTDPGEPGDCCNYHQQPGCENDVIQQCVCAADPWCCDEGWDGKCIMAAVESCGARCGGGDSGGAGGSCCVPHDDPGCEDTTIQQCVCGADPFCCDQEWDLQCVQQANGQCDAMCS